MKKKYIYIISVFFLLILLIVILFVKQSFVDGCKVKFLKIKNDTAKYKIICEKGVALSSLEYAVNDDSKLFSIKKNLKGSIKVDDKVKKITLYYTYDSCKKYEDECSPITDFVVYEKKN